MHIAYKKEGRRPYWEILGNLGSSLGITSTYVKKHSSRVKVFMLKNVFLTVWTLKKHYH